MKLSEIRALLKQHGHKTTAEIDRVDVKKAFGTPTGVDVMFTNGTVAFLPVTEEAAS